jgi:hypothetical protein
MAKIIMKVIPEPASNTRTIVESFSANPVLEGESANQYVCGACGEVLIDHVPHDEIQNIVVRCSKCKAFNEVPP